MPNFATNTVGTFSSIHSVETRQVQPIDSGCTVGFASRHSRINLVFEVLERCKAGSLLGTVRLATAKRVECVAV